MPAVFKKREHAYKCMGKCMLIYVCVVWCVFDMCVVYARYLVCVLVTFLLLE